MYSFIFDFNGTLYQDSEVHISAWRTFLARRGIPMTTEDFLKYMCGPPNSAILRRFLDPDLTEAQILALSEEKEGIYREIVLSDPKYLKLTPGAEEMLNMLKERSIPFAMATGSTPENVDFYFKTLGIGRWFDRERIVCAEPGMPGKPDPAVYRLAMQRMGFAPGQTTVVEDGMAGIQSAVGAGIERIIAIDATLGPDAFVAIPQIKAVIHDFHGFERFI